MTFVSMVFGTMNMARYAMGKEWMENITNVRRLHPTVTLQWRTNLACRKISK